MICIVVALELEAGPIIENYNLKNVGDPHFRIYENEYMSLIISGTGKLRSSIATTYLLSKVEDKDKAGAINIGLCGSYERAIKIGTPVLINKIIDIDTGYEFFPDILFSHSMIEGQLGTHPKIISPKDIKEIECARQNGFVDMEGVGFFNAANTFLAPHRISLVKIVSDHLEGIRLERDAMIAIIRQSMDRIDAIIRCISEEISSTIEILDAHEKEYLDNIADALRLTTTQRHELFDMAFKYKLRTEKRLPKFNNISFNIDSKREGKKEFEKIKQTFWGR
ncbi:MAG: hypothetical protein GX974_09260 [Clostridiales bacterium]|nr:hypothetical protein [Clostridiales bacterium]